MCALCTCTQCVHHRSSPRTAPSYSAHASCANSVLTLFYVCSIFVYSVCTPPVMYTFVHSEPCVLSVYITGGSHEPDMKAQFVRTLCTPCVHYRRFSRLCTQCVQYRRYSRTAPSYRRYSRTAPLYRRYPRTAPSYSAHTSCPNSVLKLF